MSFLFGLVLFAVVLVFVFVMVPARVLAQLILTVIPVALMVVGAGLILARQVGLGTMALFGGLALWRRFRGVGTFGGAIGGGSRTRRAERRSSVRSAALEMELDHESGAMNGLVLVGRFEGRELEELDKESLLILRSEIEDDPDSLALLEAYLDRRFAQWRENAQTDAGSGQAGAARTGPMGEEEAYEVLGLSPGASASEIRKAHRRLMKAAHPDSGGSTFLAAKINEAKDVLLKSHL